MHVPSDGESSHRTPLVRLIVAVIFTAAIAGITGWFFSHLLHLIERLAYGESATFIEAVLSTDSSRRVIFLALAGAIGGVSWALLHHTRRGIVTVTQGVNGAKMPLLTTFAHATTQVVIVALGASIGREVAPREVSAALSGWCCDRLGLSAQDRRLIVACGAGAGLAAVYSIPISGAIFALEVLIVSLTPRALWCACLISGLSVLVAQGPIRPEPFYTVTAPTSTPSLLLWALIAGPILGTAGWGFSRLVKRAEDLRPTTPLVLVTLPVIFTLVGLIAVWIPQVMGNGQATAQAGFDAHALAALVPVLSITCAKAITTLGTIASGAWGGTLTPGIALGAGFGAVGGLAWSTMFPDISITACALIGAMSFLGSSMRAPLTALALVLEFTHQGATILVPALIALGLSWAITCAFTRLSEASHPTG